MQSLYAFEMRSILSFIRTNKQIKGNHRKVWVHSNGLFYNCVACVCVYERIYQDHASLDYIHKIFKVDIINNFTFPVITE